MKKLSIPLVIVLALVLLGIYADMQNITIGSFIVPLILVAFIFFIYKYPPSKWGKAKSRSNRTHMSDEQRYKEAVKKQQMKQKSSQASSTKPKTLPFKVIEGGREDNDTPRYH